ncbi:MAG: hypothetical protein VW955_06495, partial [Gammaproteobacteria bacterium]
EWNKRSSNYIFEFLPEIKDKKWEEEEFIMNTLSFPFWQRLTGISKRTNTEIKNILFKNLKKYFYLPEFTLDLCFVPSNR